MKTKYLIKLTSLLVNLTSNDSDIYIIHEKIINFSTKFNNIKIKEYVNKDLKFEYVELLKKITKIVGVSNICELTIGKN